MRYTSETGIPTELTKDLIASATPLAVELSLDGKRARLFRDQVWQTLTMEGYAFTPQEFERTMEQIMAALAAQARELAKHGGMYSVEYDVRTKTEQAVQTIISRLSEMSSFLDEESMRSTVENQLKSELQIVLPTQPDEELVQILTEQIIARLIAQESAYAH